MKRKRKFPVLLLFFLGFLAGNLIPNIIWKIKWQQKTWASIYFLSTFAGKDISGIEYLKEIMKYRGCFYLLNVICGFSVFGEPLSVITLIASGLYTGIIMSASILEFGFAGGVIGMGLLLPQYLFYIPVWLYSMEQEWIMSSEFHKSRMSRISVQKILNNLLCFLHTVKFIIISRFSEKLDILFQFLHLRSDMI